MARKFRKGGAYARNDKQQLPWRAWRLLRLKTLRRDWLQVREVRMQESRETLRSTTSYSASSGRARPSRQPVESPGFDEKLSHFEKTVAGRTRKPLTPEEQKWNRSWRRNWRETSLSVHGRMTP